MEKLRIQKWIVTATDFRLYMHSFFKKHPNQIFFGWKWPYTRTVSRQVFISKQLISKEINGLIELNESSPVHISLPL